MSWKPYGYARVPVASDADVNNLETQHPVLADCEQDFEDVGSGASWNRPGLNRLKAVLQLRDCVKVAALDRLGRSLTEVLDLLGWLRENQVEAISLRESIDQDSAMGGDAAPRHRLRGDGARPGPGENTGGAGAGKCHRLAPRAVQGSQPEAVRRDPEHAAARWTLVGPHRSDNRVALQQRPPDLRLESRRDSADGLRGRITGPPGCCGSWPSRTDWAIMGIGYGLRATKM